MILRLLPLEKEMATHSSTLAWKIPWMEEPGRLQSTGSQRVGHGWATSLTRLLQVTMIIHVNHLKYGPGIKTSLHMYYPYYKGGSNWYIWQFTDPLWLLPLQMVKVRVKSLSRVQLFATPWTIANQVPPFMGFSRQKYHSGLPFPSSGDLPDPGTEPKSPAL